MKNIFLILVAAVALLASCSEDDSANFNQQITDPHTLYLNDSTIPESGGMINMHMEVKNEDEGVLFYAVSQTAITPPSAYDIITGNVDGLAVGEFNVTTDAYVHDVELKGYTQYFVYTVLRNVYDEITSVVIDTLIAGDITGPALMSEYSIPSFGGVGSTSQIIELVFDEPVFMTNNLRMELAAMRMIPDDLPEVTSTVRVKQSNVEIDYNRVSIDLGAVNFECGNHIYLTALAGSFEDASGNPSEKIGWVHDGTEMVSTDYFYIAKDEANDTLYNFLGQSKVFTMVDGSPNGPSANFNIAYSTCSNGKGVLLGDLFGVHNNVEFMFDFENGGIKFEEFETGIYYDSESNGFHIGDPDTTTHHRVFYKPNYLDEDRNVGKYSLPNKSFYVTYEVFIDNIGGVFDVVSSYEKDANAFAASAKSAQAKSASAQHQKIIQALEAFRNRN